MCNFDTSRSTSDYLVVFAGQSNMLGHRSATDGQKPINSRVFAWSDDGREASWRIAELGRPPFNTAVGQPNNAALHFADALQRKSGGRVHLIGRPINGSTLLSWSSPTASNMAQLLADIAAGIDALPPLDGSNWKVDSFLWCQGESDDEGATMVKERKVATLAAYRSEFERLVQILQAQSWWSAESSKFIAAELVANGWLAARNDFYGDPSQWPAGLKMGVAPSADLGDIGDRAHFNGKALATMGLRMHTVRERLAASAVL